MSRGAAATALAIAASAAGVAAIDFSAADNVLQSAIASQVFPGCAAGVLSANGSVLYRKAFGSYVYPGQSTPLGGNNPAVTTGTLFDMASITKIIGGTTASALLYQAGLLDLDMLVSDPSLLGPAYAQNGKNSVRVRDCLLHQAGYPPDPSPAYNDPAFGCPATSLQSPPLTFNCSELIFDSLLAQDLQYPTGTQWLYSDLSLITMQYVVGTVVAANALVEPADLLPACGDADPTRQPGLYKTCHFEAFVRTQVLAGAGMPASNFLPNPALWPSAMPTWEDPVYRHELVQGAVSDENSYALGGIAGHAGVFSSLDDMLQFVGMWAGYTGAQGEEAPLRRQYRAWRHGGHGHHRRQQSGAPAERELSLRLGQPQGTEEHGAHKGHRAGSHAHGARHQGAGAGESHHDHHEGSGRHHHRCPHHRNHTRVGFASLITEATRDLFFTAPDPSFSPRALGWVTQAATDDYLGCGNFSSLTAYHTGYTGELLRMHPRKQS